MNNVAKVAKYIKKRPDAAASRVFLELAVALETGGPFLFSKLYELDLDEYTLAIGMMDDWRLDRYYMSKLHLLDFAEFMEVLLPK